MKSKVVSPFTMVSHLIEVKRDTFQYIDDLDGIRLPRGFKMGIALKSSCVPNVDYSPGNNEYWHSWCVSASVLVSALVL